MINFVTSRLKENYFNDYVAIGTHSYSMWKHFEISEKNLRVKLSFVDDE